MKLTLILSYTAAGALALFVACVITPHDAALGFAILATAAATLIAVHDYTPRSYFVVTPRRRSLNTTSCERVPFTSLHFGSARRKVAKRTVARVA